MNGVDYRCPRCGSIMAQTGSVNGKVTYHCKSCGYNEYVTISNDDNSEYWMKRAELLSRTTKGVMDWKITQWDQLRRDILDFVGRYDQAHVDIHFKMALIACLTSGFHDMDSEKYKECKQIFKVTERLYKIHCKALKETGGGSIEDVEKYEEYRVMYKKCRNEYRNTKIMWKAALTVAKLFIPKI